MSALLDIWHTIQGIVTHADWITLVIIAVVAIVGGFAIQGLNSILSATVLGLVGFVLLVFLRAVTLGKQDFTAYAHTGWHDVLGLQNVPSRGRRLDRQFVSALLPVGPEFRERPARMVQQQAGE